MKKIQIIIISMLLIVTTVLFPIRKAGATTMGSIGTSIVENGTVVANRDYNSDDSWEGTASGALFSNMTEEIDNFKLGKRYSYKISVKNSGDIDTYVRMIITKTIQDANGDKDTTISPELIELEFSDEDWIIAEDQSTPERAVCYYKKILEMGSTTPNLINSIKVDNSIGKISTEKLVTDENGYETIEVGYAGAEKSFKLDMEVDAVQTHNAAAAIKSAWGVNVTVDSNGDIELN